MWFRTTARSCATISLPRTDLGAALPPFMSQPIQSIRGMSDILPDEAPLWRYFEEGARSWLRRYGYREIRMPLVEKTELFVRSIGEVTDIVEKEMYTFTDLNGESVTLRPEGTASCVR